MPSLHRRRVKIVCTLGPSSNSREMIASLISDGLDVARLNFSHGTHEFHRELIRTIREEARKAGRHIAIMQDLQGPKLRAGILPGGMMELKPGDKLLLHPEGSAPKATLNGKIPLPISAEIALSVSRDVRAGSKILFDDGRIATRVLETLPPEIVVQVENGGRLTNHKGMNLPETPLSLGCLCAKDLEDLKFGLAEGVDAVALSFVRSPEDIKDLREKIKSYSNAATSTPWVIAKIEREEALDCMEQIIPLVDGLLIARGDMAVEIGAERVPSVQKKLIRMCNVAGVPVITATQMLESMMEAPTPTRAEASDVANAVFDGTDAVMLSGETAAGKYPREALQTMIRIALDAEQSTEEPRHIQDSIHVRSVSNKANIVDSIGRSAAMISEQIGARVIACVSVSGLVVKALARYRPKVSIVAITDDEAVLRKLAFLWGAGGIAISKLVATDDVFGMIEGVLVERGWAEVEDLVVITAGVPILKRGMTNTLKVHRIGLLKERS